jgi:hypothetical protein
VHIGDAFGIAFARVPDGDDCLDHPPMLRPLGLPPQELFRASSAIVRPLRGDRRPPVPLWRHHRGLRRFSITIPRTR